MASIEDLAIKSNGKISIVGNSLGYFYLGRLNSNGTMDTSFSSDGFNDNFQGRMFGIELNNDDSFFGSIGGGTGEKTRVAKRFSDIKRIINETISN